MKRVAVKFCGNCNPHIDIRALYLILRSAGICEFLPVDHPQCEYLLVLSGCPTDCATRPPFAGKVIVVAGAALNNIPCPEDALAGKILQLLT
ncbi:MAG: hypothetical protein ACYCX4_00785 [Bacillota bacterium]